MAEFVGPAGRKLLDFRISFEKVGVKDQQKGLLGSLDKKSVTEVENKAKHFTSPDNHTNMFRLFVKSKCEAANDQTKKMYSMTPLIGFSSTV